MSLWSATMTATQPTGKNGPVTIDASTRPEWVSEWSDLVNKLHTTPLLVPCPECGADIRLTREHVDAHGVTLYCKSCEDYLRRRPAPAFLDDLDAAGVAI